MIDIRTGKKLKDVPVLDEPKTYIYIMLNDAGKIKIGKTKNIQQRYQSLCGSNGQGNLILKVYCSPDSYLHTLEDIMHSRFSKYRVPKTEWFYDANEPSGEKLFDNATKELQLLFSSTDYKRCNNVRKEMYERQLSKGDVNNDY